MNLKELNNDFGYIEGMGDVQYSSSDVNLSNLTAPFKISQSLIKECLNNDHCPKQIMYSFIEGRELIEPSEAMTLGRYFESELLGACRGGEKQEAKTKTDGTKYKVYADVDVVIEFARECFEKMGIDISKGQSQLFIESELLSGNIDHINEFNGEKCIIDVKWTASKLDDRWNGWADAENKDQVEIQPSHYQLTYFEKHGVWLPFYYFIFGKDLWFRIIKVEVSDEAMNNHKDRIAYTASKISQYASENYKGKGNFNKCSLCPFKDECEDRVIKPEIEIIQV